MKFLEALTICNSQIAFRRNGNRGLPSSESLSPAGFIELQMINGEGTCKAACEVVSLDPFDSLTPLQVPQYNDGDVSSPSTRYSSCGESDFDRYCSANSVMGTPSMCSTITVFNDFTEYDSSGLENFSLGERVEITSKDQGLSSTGASDSTRYLRTGFCSENIQTQQNLKCSTGGLELYGDDDDVIAMPMLDASDFMGTNQLGNDLDQNFIRKDVEGSEVSKGRKKIGGDTEYLETLSGDGSDDAGITEKYLLGDVDGKCSQSVPADGGEYEHNGRESNLQIGEAKDPNIVKPQVQDVEKLVNCPETSFTTEDYEVGFNLLAEEAPNHMTFDFNDDGNVEEGNLHTNTEEAIGTSDAQHVKNPELDNSKVKFDQFFNSKVDLKSFNLATHPGNINAESFENLERVVPSSNCEMRKALDYSSTSSNLSEKIPVVSKMEDFEPHEFYNDVVHEMEEILLDSIDSTGSRLAQGNRLLEPQLSMPLRDGGLTASTSGTDGACLLLQTPMRLDRVEVVGARQKKGDVSFRKRLVGMKEYTVYKIKVWSGKDQWEIERRYRDFLTLYHHVKILFTEQGWDLPSPWYTVEKETKNIFGSASPGVIVQRSVLLQECLQSILHIRFFSSPPSALIWFLSPPSALVSNSSFTRTTINRNYSSLGKTVSIIVEIPPCKSMKQMLEAQHNRCAGCHRRFDDRKTLIWDFVQTFGWGKPRLCEYTGKLFCSSCHTNETAVLPARVLHHWDFTHYPVSQLAKSYLDCINDQPMLCVTAVNPILLSKVPALLHVMSVRKKIQTMLPYVLCPFRRSINRGLGMRRYLLESNDFFALKDLIDLSKGAFAALPVMVETVSRKILKHITDQCIECCDVGLPCSARQDCSDPCSLIFPFQEDEIERCTACQSVFHKPCFRKLANCSCGAHLRLTHRVRQGGIVETTRANRVRA